MLFGMPNPVDARNTLTLEDEKAIIDATIRYCWAIDTRDYADLESVFTEDVECDYSTVSPPFNGLEPLKELVAGVLGRLDSSQHMVSNHQIEMTADGPRSRCYFHAQHVRQKADGGPNYIVAGIYVDDWQQTSAGWRSCRRSLRVLWTEGNSAVVAS
jgi:hypothetical protein